MLYASDSFFDEEVLPQMMAHGWTWYLSEPFCPNDPSRHIEDKLATTLSSNMEAWLGGFPIEAVSLSWSMILKQQEKHTIPSPTLEALVTALCTIREQDFQSLRKAVACIKCLRQGVGMVGHIANCVLHCDYGDDGYGTCRDECTLRLAFSKGMHKNTNVHVRAMRDVVKHVGGILTKEQRLLFPPGYTKVAVKEVVVDQPNDPKKPSGHCVHPDSLAEKEWLKVPGVKEVVFGKLLSLSRVGEWTMCKEDVVMAVDTKLLGLVVRMGSKTTAEVFGEEVFGCEPALSFATLTKRVKSHPSLKHVKVVLATMARGDHERRVYRVNGLRSNLATHIQTHHVVDMTKMFCDEFGYDVRNARHVDALRESLRFMFDLFSHNAKKAPDGRRSVEFCIWSASRSFVPSHGMGPTYVPMSVMLSRDDLAYWWQHPGQVMRVADTSTILPSTHGPRNVTPQLKIFLGTTRDEAIGAALDSCASDVDLVRALADETIAVCYWGMHSTDNESSWSFELTSLSPSIRSVGIDSITSMLCGFYTFWRSGRLTIQSIRARVRAMLDVYDGDYEQMIVDLESEYASTFNRSYIELHEESTSLVLSSEMRTELPPRLANDGFTCFDDQDAFGKMRFLLWTKYKVSDPRLIFELGEKMLQYGTPLSKHRRALRASIQEGAMSALDCVPWTLTRGEPIEWSFVEGSIWEKMKLGGAPRWQKAITCDLGEDVSVLTAYALKNTAARNSNLFASQREHQKLHCDLVHPSVGKARSSVEFAMRVWVLITQLRNDPIALQLWDHELQREKTIWLHRGEYIVFRACTCWHGGYGGEQGDRLYVTFVIGEVTTYDRACFEHDALKVLTWDVLLETPSIDPTKWRTKYNTSK